MKKGIFMAASLAPLMSGMGGAESALGRAYLNARQLEAIAGEQLSNYSGGYDGYGDEFLEFSGGDGGSFMDAIHKGKVYNLTLTNSANAVRTSLLCPGLIGNAAGLIADGAYNDTNGNAGMSASGSPMSIAFFNAFVRQFPTLIAGFKISTSNIAQFEQVLTIYKQSPWTQHEARIINPAIYASEANPNTQLITIGESFQLDSQTVITYPVLTSTTVNIGLVSGVSLNIAKALKSKASMARSAAPVAPAAKTIRG